MWFSLSFKYYLVNLDFKMAHNSLCNSGEYSNSRQSSYCQFGDNSEQILNNPTKTWSYRPHSALARALYEKHISDEQLESMDKNQVCTFYFIGTIYILY